MDAREQLNETVKKSDLSPLLFQFQKEEQKEILLLNGEPVTADLTYMDIWREENRMRIFSWQDPVFTTSPR